MHFDAPHGASTPLKEALRDALLQKLVSGELSIVKQGQIAEAKT
jgi:hypothetical protein